MVLRLNKGFESLVMKNKTVKVILEIVKLVATALIGYFGGNAVM